MDINEKNIIILDDDNKYVVVKKLTIENIIYYYIIDINNFTNIKYLYENGNELIEIEDENVVQNIIKVITQQTDLESLLNESKKYIEQINQ